MSEPKRDEESIFINLGPRSYSIRVVSGQDDAFMPFLRASLQATWAGRPCQRLLLVTDTNVAPQAHRYETCCREAGFLAQTVVVPAGEASKSLAQAESLYDRLCALPADRHTTVMAVGGGVVGDLAGFVAATYARGLPLFMIPTSLLAQVDSAVGGKVGVNLPRAKNMVGAFHQPVGVWIDTESLASLPERELKSGLAEVVKYGVILDAEFFAQLEAAVPRIQARDAATLRWIVGRSCQYKAQVVTQDEREETGLRAVLNFGHSIAHAVESARGYGAVLHGEAVAIGMVAESRLAERLGWVGPELTARIEALLTALGLPTALPTSDSDELLAVMSRDKKNRSGKLRFVLPRGLGRVELTDRPTEDLVRSVLAGASGHHG